jgi:hypothetical protein
MDCPRAPPPEKYHESNPLEHTWRASSQSRFIHYFGAKCRQIIPTSARNAAMNNKLSLFMLAVLMLP